MYKDIPPGGKHLILDLWTDEKKLLSSLPFLENLCYSAANASGATIIDSRFHHFGGIINNDMSPFSSAGVYYGVTGILILAESHISIHTWPEEKYAAIDIFMCGSCDPSDTISIFFDGLGGCSMDLKYILRGQFSESYKK